MSRVTNTQLLAAITGMASQVDSLSERVNSLESKPSKTAAKSAAKPLVEGIAVPVGHLVLVKIQKGLDRKKAAQLMGTGVEQVGYTANLAKGRIGKALRQFDVIQPDTRYGGPAFFTKRCESAHAIGSKR